MPGSVARRVGWPRTSALSALPTIPPGRAPSAHDRDPGPETRRQAQRHNVLPDELNGTLTLGNGGAVFAAGGIGPRGKVVVEHAGGAVGVAGVMSGNITVRGYTYAYLEGPLTGTLDIQSYAQVCLRDDVHGTLRVRSYTELLLKGRMLGRLDAKGSCWCTFYLDGHYTQADLAAFVGDLSQITVHVRTSDLPEGGHEDIGTWRKVIVGDAFWKKVPE